MPAYLTSLYIVWWCFHIPFTIEMGKLAQHGHCTESQRVTGSYWGIKGQRRHKAPSPPCMALVRVSHSGSPCPQGVQGRLPLSNPRPREHPKDDGVGLCTAPLFHNLTDVHTLGRSHHPTNRINSHSAIHLILTFNFLETHI